MLLSRQTAFGFAKTFLQAPLSFQFLDDSFDLHMGSNATRLALQRGASPTEYAPFATDYAFLFPAHLRPLLRSVAASWLPDEQAFLKLRSPYLLYHS